MKPNRCCDTLISELRPAAYGRFRTTDGMLVTEGPGRDALPMPCTAKQSCSRSDSDAVAIHAIHDHDHPVTSRRKGSWLPTRAILIFGSMVFSIFLAFPLSIWRHSFPIPCLSADAMVQRPSDSTSDGMTLPRPAPVPFSSNGRTDQVQWDNYTLLLRGQRVLI